MEARQARERKASVRARGNVVASNVGASERSSTSTSTCTGVHAGARTRLRYGRAASAARPRGPAMCIMHTLGTLLETTAGQGFQASCQRSNTGRSVHAQRSTRSSLCSRAVARLRARSFPATRFAGLRAAQHLFARRANAMHPPCPLPGCRILQRPRPAGSRGGPSEISLWRPREPRQHSCTRGLGRPDAPRKTVPAARLARSPAESSPHSECWIVRGLKCDWRRARCARWRLGLIRARGENCGCFGGSPVVTLAHTFGRVTPHVDVRRGARGDAARDQRS